MSEHLQLHIFALNPQINKQKVCGNN